MIRDMKSIKIWSLLAMLFIGLAGCELIPDDGSGDGGSSTGNKIVDEWCLVSWCGEVPPFNVYIEFKADETFDMYEQVYDLTYEYVSGTYMLSNRKLSGIYSNGSLMKSKYKVAVTKTEDGKLLELTDDENTVSVYKAMPIPEGVKAEAMETRASGAEYFL